MKKLIVGGGVAFSAILFFPTIVFALEIQQPGDWVKYTDLGVLLSNLIALVFIVAALIFFFMLVVGGIQWMVSGGDKAATEAARGRITAALIGLVIVFAAWAIVKLIETFLGIQFLGKEIPIPTPR